MDANRLLEQFMGANRVNTDDSGNAQGNSALGGMLGGGFGKGAAVGGVLGLLLGSKKMRKMAGGVIGYGGAAAAGAVAYKAYQNWQQGKQVQTAPIATPADLHNVDPRFLPPPANPTAGQNFSLTLISAMIAAAKADGHIDAKEQTVIFEQVEKMSLDAESKAFVFDALRKPVDIDLLVSGVQGIEQASEVYLVSRIAIDVDHPAERAYLQVLVHRLNLPSDLVAHLDHQVVDA
ncbi:MAG: tellurite resistance TerB family protein [Pseudohongiella sp.]|nr:tellurite resistance TerB family protein [Pseudohongiella sp.]MDO9519635.1 tellurite resistance TerB family protein [Pseudohongiella sp.]